MRCPECVSVGVRSTVTPGLMTTTLMWSPPFYDEDGQYHDHDPNKRVSHFTCSNGHAWSETRLQKCPSCGWPDAA